MNAVGVLVASIFLQLMAAGWVLRLTRVTGLGLPIVQRIMERHSGGLDIASASRRGTQACLWLPIERGAEQGIRECA